MTAHESSRPQLRILIVAFSLFSLLALLIVQFYQIQIIEGDKWNAVADRQHFFTVHEPFMRGRFFSNTSLQRNHPETPQILVSDVQKFHLHVDAVGVPPEYKEEIIQQLLKFLALPQTEWNQFEQQFNFKSRNRKLALWLDRELKDLILEWWLPYAKKRKIPYNVLFFVSDYQRSYPFGKLLGQVLQTVQHQRDEFTKQAIPTGGLELYFDSFLKGKQGERRLMRSPRNSFEIGEVIAKPENGADIHLTINHCLQAIAEDELAKGVQKAKAKSGWAVMMDPFTGEILALAQYPFFYPKDYQTYFNDPSKRGLSKVQALSDAVEPGSIMKSITLAVGLKANEELRSLKKKPLFDPEEKFNTSNSKFPGRSKPLKDTHFHAFLNMSMGLQKSSNVYMARLIERVVNELGIDFYRKTLCDVFGFGEKTGLELPAESAGVVPMPGKKHPNGTLEWSASTPFTLAMGHNIQVNALQMVRAYAVFANGGYLVKPTLIRKITKTTSDGDVLVLKDHTKQDFKKFPKVLSHDICRQIKQVMKYATKPGGTASKANVWGYTEAGKTGTSNKVIQGTYSEKLFVSSFVGFCPVEKPAFVLLVSIDEPEYGFMPGVGKKHHGGTCAAPVFREIAKRSLEYLGIPPDDPHGYPRGDPRFDAEKADWYPEVKKLKKLYDEWNAKEKA